MLKLRYRQPKQFICTNNPPAMPGVEFTRAPTRHTKVGASGPGLPTWLGAADGPLRAGLWSKPWHPPTIHLDQVLVVCAFLDEAVDLGVGVGVCVCVRVSV